MRITDLKASLVSTGLPWDYQDLSKGYMDALLVQIETDAGITGTYLSWERLQTNKGLAEMLVKSVKPHLVGKNAYDREKIWQLLISWNRRGLPTLGTGAIDVCLWDIAGKAANLPLHQMMGSYRDKIRVYASCTTFKTIEDYATQSLKLKAQGYTAIKFHVRGDPKWDVEACKAAREAVPDMTLILDSSTHYNRQQALWVGREIEKLNYYWYESPLPDSDVEGLAELARVLDIPIAAAEYLYECDTSHFTPFLTAVDIIRCDARRGISPARKIADMCAAFHIPCELHSWGSIIGQAANLHIMGAIKNCEFFEQPVPTERFEVCAKDHLVMDAEGYMHMPTKPGIGVELDWDEVDRRTTFVAS